MARHLIFPLIAFLTGALSLYLFFWPEITTSIIEKRRVDTVYVEVKEVIRFESPMSKSLEDSVEYYKELYKEELARENITIVKEGEPFSAPLRRYDGFRPTLYGNISYNAIVAGSLLKMTLRQDLKMPHITNTVERTITNTIEPKALFLTGGVSSDFRYSIGAIYVNKKSLFGYKYSPQFNTHELMVGFSIFRR